LLNARTATSPTIGTAGHGCCASTRTARCGEAESGVGRNVRTGQMVPWDRGRRLPRERRGRGRPERRAHRAAACRAERPVRGAPAALAVWIEALFHRDPDVAALSSFPRDAFVAVTSAQWHHTHSLYGPLFTLSSAAIARWVGSVGATIFAFKLMAGVAIAATT